jgi:hypothetical protein
MFDSSFSMTPLIISVLAQEYASQVDHQAFPIRMMAPQIDCWNWISGTDAITFLYAWKGQKFVLLSRLVLGRRFNDVGGPGSEVDK